MNTPGTTWSVLYFDGHKPHAQPATLIWGERSVKLIGQQADRLYNMAALRVSPRVGSADRFVALPDGGQLQCPDQALLDNLPQESRSEGAAAWLERQWGVALLCVVLMIAGVGLGYRYGLPAAAEAIVPHVPLSYEQRVGERGLEAMDKQGWFSATKLPLDTRQRILEGFYKLSLGLPSAERLHLEFRKASPMIGPNAFSLPGGTIVITDQMVKLARTPAEVSAILAHEIGHVERRHALRHVLQDSVAALIAATLTADASGAGAVATSLPALLVQASYSREFETEADDFAFDLLKRHNLSPANFANVMARLEREHDAKHSKSAEKGAKGGGGQSDSRQNDAKDSAYSFLSSHPITAERIARARAAAGNFVPDATAVNNQPFEQEPESEHSATECQPEETPTEPGAKQAVPC